MDYLIRKCTQNDVENLVLLCKNHADYEKASYYPEGKAALLKQILFVKNPKLFCLIVELDNKIVGYATYTFDCSTWDAAPFLYMDCLYLEPECRGFNIGEVIIKQLLNIAKKHNCVNVQWQTPNFNDRAIKFYKRVGASDKEKVRFFMTV
jgi:GNAT superfamily N-acetyltransferase